MKALIAGLFLASTFAAGTAMAQPAPFNEAGLTWGHWHIISKDVEVNKKLFLGMGAKMFIIGGNPFMMFPGTYINLTLGQEKGEGGSQGSVVNHVGFIVDNVQKRVAEWKAKGVTVLPGGALPTGGNRLDASYILDELLPLFDWDERLLLYFVEEYPASASRAQLHETLHMFIRELKVAILEGALSDGFP